MKKTLLVMIVLALAGYAGLRWFGGARTAATDGERLAIDRLWIDHLPVHDRDTAQLFILLGDHNMGVFQATTAWRGSYEVFRYEGQGNELDVVFPQTGDREKVRTRASRCSERGMDFCLEVSGSSRGVKRYYSRKGWEIEGARTVDDIQHRVDAILPVSAS